jgi:hypothetical protein
MMKSSFLLAALLTITFFAFPAHAQKATTQPAAGEPSFAITQSLFRTLPEVTFDGVGFADATDFLRDVSGANVFVDWIHLEKAGVDRNAPVSVKLRNVKFSGALQAICDSAGKGKAVFKPVKNVIVISTKEGADRFATAVSVDTSKWDDASQKAMRKQLPEVTFDGVGLSDVVDFLRDATHANFVVDWNAMEKAGIDKNRPVGAKLRNVAFGDALGMIFQSMTETPIVISSEKGIVTISAAETPAKK